MPEILDDEMPTAAPARWARARRWGFVGVAGLTLVGAPVLLAMAADGSSGGGEVETTDLAGSEVLSALDENAAAAADQGARQEDQALEGQAPEPAADDEDKDEPPVDTVPTTTAPPTTTTTTAPPTTEAPEPEPEVEPEPEPEPEPAAESGPAPTSGGGGLGDPYYIPSWDHLAECESGGDWSINTGNGYYGGIQFNLSSWQAVGGTGLPSDASREEQIARGQALWERQGWGAWPACTSSFGWR